MEAQQVQAMTIGQMLQSVINDQTAYMEQVLQFIDWCRTYTRSGRMLSRVCLANAPMRSDPERDAQSLAHHLTDLELWVAQQETLFQERYVYLANFAHECAKLDLSHPSDNQEATVAAKSTKPHPSRKTSSARASKHRTAKR